MYGSIKYWIEAEIQRPLFTMNNKIKTKLNVDVPLVCNDLMLPLKLSAQKSDFLFDNNGSIRMDAKIDRRAYYPGEFVVFHCNVINQSSTRVIPRVTLRQTQTYLMRKKNKTKIRQNTHYEIKCQRMEGLPTEAGSSSTQTFQVPIPIGIAISVNSPILEVSYDLHLTVDIPSAIDLHLDLPIMITTKNVVNQYKPYNSEYKMT
ncbi:unnamed protein product [Oppiella nova]|uniref:Arrestin C-terminal-like domain-containing protein n=1 Tax=Oppiella nova TaxID=334625 RepID=A0A7R9QNV1_9ACAR|nr:unnamed protein product [Oppiella nova]CAG2168966.1 unnamed protein product [Oppiella nova]